jgi:hypothetical protein
MSNNNMFRLGGIAAIGSAVLYILSLVGSMASASGVGTALYILSSLLFVVTIVVLTMVLRGESGILAVIALICLGIMTIWGMFLDPTDISPIFGPLTLVYGVGFLIFGWLQYRSAQFPKAVGILAIATGALALIGGVTLIAGGSFDIFGMLNLALSVPYVIWLFWMGRQWLTAGRQMPVVQG